MADEEAGDGVHMVDVKVGPGTTLSQIQGAIRSQLLANGAPQALADTAAERVADKLFMDAAKAQVQEMGLTAYIGAVSMTYLTDGQGMDPHDAAAFMKHLSKEHVGALVRTAAQWMLPERLIDEYWTWLMGLVTAENLAHEGDMGRPN